MSELAQKEKKRGIDRYKSRAAKSSDLIHRLFTEGDTDGQSMVSQLWAMFNDMTMIEGPRGSSVPAVSVAEKLKIAQFFAKQSHNHALAAEHLGILLKKDKEPTQQAQTIVNMQVQGGLTFEERLARIEADVNGVPLVGDGVIEAAADEVTEGSE